MQRAAPKWRTLNIRAECPDGHFRTVHKVVEVILCERCGGSMHPGEHFTKREGKAPVLVTSKPSVKYDRKRYPVCRGCCPFTEIER
jgi:hypothetical protein